MQEVLFIETLDAVFIQAFWKELSNESIDVKELGIPFKESDVKRILQTVFY